MSDRIEIRLVDDGAPQAFLWRGRLYVIVKILSRGQGTWRVKARPFRGDSSVFDIHWDGDGWHLTEIA